jgi:hypothetical protein
LLSLDRRRTRPWQRRRPSNPLVSLGKSTTSNELRFHQSQCTLNKPQTTSKTSSTLANVRGNGSLHSCHHRGTRTTIRFESQTRTMMGLPLLLHQRRSESTAIATARICFRVITHGRQVRIQLKVGWRLIWSSGWYNNLSKIKDTTINNIQHITNETIKYSFRWHATKTNWIWTVVLQQQQRQHGRSTQ